MKNLGYYLRVMTGVVVGSVVAGIWFSISSTIIDSNSFIKDFHDHEDKLQMLKSRLIFNNIIIISTFIIYVFIGLPVYFVVDKLRKANLISAVIAGFIVGISVSYLIGMSFHLSTLHQFIIVVMWFGGAGVVASLPLWFFVEKVWCTWERN